MKSIAIYGINGSNSGYLAEKRVIVKILGASPEAFEFPDLKIEGTKQASGN